MITFKRWGNFIVSDSSGLERGCDSVHDISTPLCISVVFSVNSKHKINRVQKKKHNKLA